MYPPVELLRASAPVVSGETVWYWCNTDRTKLSALLATLDLSDAKRAELLALARPEVSIAGLTMRPSQELIRKLTAKEREEIYASLSAYPQNADQGLAFRFLATPWNSGLEGMSIPPRSPIAGGAADLPARRLPVLRRSAANRGGILISRGAVA